MRQLWENESKNDNDEKIVFSDDEYVPPDEENISSDKDTVQCTSRKTIYEPMLRHIKNCTEEAHRQLGKKECSTTLDEQDDLYQFCMLEYGAINLELDSLFSVVWYSPFFYDTMARYRFRKLMKFLRFDKKTS
ncbi:hypothetical protein TNCV_3104901 [Trichonephila clavipes]|nr:hypothetical protein TNCV_3104901 [Trichonephila clavipes]